MAWNQPGGNGGKDPWGDRGGQQGPPDLDEVLKKLQARWGRFFGGKPGGGGLGGGLKLGGGGSFGIIAVLVVVVLGWAAYGIYIVDPAEQAVVLRFGKYVRTTGPGPHWAPPFIESVEKVNVQQIRSQEIGFRSQGGSRGSVPHEALMLTEDENIIDIQFAVQYRVKDPADFLFQVAEPELTLRQVTESAVREIVGRSTMDFVITEGRDAVAAETQLLMQDILDRYRTGVDIRSVNMQDAQPPGQVQDAFLDAIKAREDQERIINEANAYRNDVVPKARGEANAVLQGAEGYQQRVIAQAEGETSRFLQVLAEYQNAPEITRKRLYLEAIESVMANSSKVMLDVEGSSNLMYLPLDRLIGTRPNSPGRIGDGRSTEGRSSDRPNFDSTRRSRDSLTGRNR